VNIRFHHRGIKAEFAAYRDFLFDGDLYPLMQLLGRHCGAALFVSLNLKTAVDLQPVSKSPACMGLQLLRSSPEG
jgi:hypothetical protein